MIPWDHILVPWQMKTSTDTVSNHCLPFQRKPKYMSREGVVVHFDALRKMTNGWEVRRAPGTMLPLRAGHAQSTPLGTQLSWYPKQRSHPQCKFKHCGKRWQNLLSLRVFKTFCTLKMIYTLYVLSQRFRRK